MSTSTVSRVVLICDTCGSDLVTNVKGATAARLAAASEGWKFAEWDVRGLSKYGKRSRNGVTPPAPKIVPHQWDCCPGCPLPVGPEEAYGIRQSRK